MPCFSLSPLSCALSNAIPSWPATQLARVSLHLTHCFSLWVALRTDRLLVLDRAQQPSGGRAQGLFLGGISQGPVVARETWVIGRRAVSPVSKPFAESPAGSRWHSLSVEAEIGRHWILWVSFLHWRNRLTRGLPHAASGITALLPYERKAETCSHKTGCKMPPTFLPPPLIYAPLHNPWTVSRTDFTLCVGYITWHL